MRPRRETDSTAVCYMGVGARDRGKESKSSGELGFYEAYFNVSRCVLRHDMIFLICIVKHEFSIKAISTIRRSRLGSIFRLARDLNFGNKRSISVPPGYVQPRYYLTYIQCFSLQRSRGI